MWNRIPWPILHPVPGRAGDFWGLAIKTNDQTSQTR
jgi:hypothetical protein